MMRGLGSVSSCLIRSADERDGGSHPVSIPVPFGLAGPRAAARGTFISRCPSGCCGAAPTGSNPSASRVRLAARDVSHFPSAASPLLMSGVSRGLAGIGCGYTRCRHRLVGGDHSSFSGHECAQQRRCCSSSNSSPSYLEESDFCEYELIARGDRAGSDQVFVHLGPHPAPSRARLGSPGSSSQAPHKRQGGSLRGLGLRGV